MSGLEVEVLPNFFAARDLPSVLEVNPSVPAKTVPEFIAQGCSTLFVVFHIAKGFEASEGSGVVILGDGVGLIEPQDIISAAAQSGAGSQEMTAKQGY